VGETIRLRGIEVDARHGVHDWEKTTPQRFVVDVACVLDRPSTDDDLGTTVDYSALATKVADIVAGDSVDLIETLAHRIAAACLDDPLVVTAEVTVHKPQAPMPVPVADIAVTVTRSKDR